MLNQYDCLRETRTQPIIEALISYRILTEIGFVTALEKKIKKNPRRAHLSAALLLPLLCSVPRVAPSPALIPVTRVDDPRSARPYPHRLLPLAL